MNKNTFSLLSSNWMFANNSENSLYPFLFDIINSNNDSKQSLNTTSYHFLFANGLFVNENDENQRKKDAIALIQVHHPIFKYDQFCGPQGTQTIMSKLEILKKADNIKGVVLDFNSGGGQASGSAEFAEYINNYPKPVVSYTKDLLGSAAYYMASGSDYIIAHKHSDFIGCIGTMIKQVNIEGILVKKGATINEFYSDLSPEKNKQSRALNEGDSKPIINEILNPLAQEFHNDVKLYRSQISEKALKGDIFNPKNALENGLIDEIGTLQTAIDKVFELSEENYSQKNMSTMNTNYANIQEVLGMETKFESTENGVFLNEEQLQTINTSLENADEDTVSTAVNEATTPLNDQITWLTAQESEITAAIDAALEEAEVERGEMTNADAIAHLSNLVAEYGANDGASHTQAIDNAGEKPNESPTIISGVNIKEALNC